MGHRKQFLVAVHVETHIVTQLTIPSVRLPWPPPQGAQVQTA